MGIKDKKYWSKWYAENNAPTNPSPFAFFCAPLFKGSNVIDAGSGNGRDGKWFLSLGFSVISYDACPSGAPNLMVCDVCDASYSNTENVYARWLLHALDENDQINFIHKVCSDIVVGSRFFIECRSIIDDHVCDDSHFRCPVNEEKLLSNILSYGMEIEHLSQSRGYSPSLLSDPLLIRLVAQKKHAI